MTHGRRQRGFSLVEMMISVAISLVAMAGVISVFARTLGGNTYALRTAQVNTDTRAIMDVMMRELRTAGYWAGAAPGAVGNPFTAPTFPAAGCALYGWDANGNSVVNADEGRGFRLASGAVQWRRSTAAAPPNCNEPANSPNWVAMNNPATVTITNLAFTPSLPCQVDIVLTGVSAVDATVTVTLNETVNLRNFC